MIEACFAFLAQVTDDQMTGQDLRAGLASNRRQGCILDSARVPYELWWWAGRGESIPMVHDEWITVAK